MDKELLTLFARIELPEPGAPPVVEPDNVASFNGELAVLGYSLDASCLDRLRTLGRDQFASERRRLLALLEEVTGAGGRHQTLFAQFPYRVPEQQAYLRKRLFGYLQEAFGYRRNDARLLSCGHVIDPDLFDLEAFGACPICQRQVDDLPYRRGGANFKFKPITPLKLLALADDGELARRGDALLARTSSLSSAERAFLRGVSLRAKLRLPETLFKETLPFAYELFGREAITPHLSGATDVLRILVFVSDPEAGDLSLAESTRLALRARHVKDAMAMLDGLRGVEADLLRHPGRWKVFARDAHVGKASFRRRYPNATAAFDKLLSSPKTIATFGRTIEPLIRSRDAPRLATVLASRPGEFLRRLDLLLRECHTEEETQIVQEKLRLVLPGVETRRLFEIAKYLDHRHGAVGQRVFLPKGATNRVQVVPDRRSQIEDAPLLAAIDAVATELRSRLAQREPMGRVHLDPALAKIVMPYNRRGDTDATVPLAKGSRYPVGAGADVIRLFVHWTGEIDVDLSVVTLSGNLDALEQVSWTNLETREMRHSGDIQSAPNGASEFIDIRIARLAETGARYLAMSLICYRGPPFGAFPAYAGFMERDDLGSGEVYEPQSVALKFDVTARSRSCLPVLFDIREREIVYLDIAAGGGAYQAVGRQKEKFQALARMALDLPNTKPTALDVLSAHVAARGTRVDDPADAERTYSRDGLDLEEVMALMS